MHACIELLHWQCSRGSITHLIHPVDWHLKHQLLQLRIRLFIVHVLLQGLDIVVRAIREGTVSFTWMFRVIARKVALWQGGSHGHWENRSGQNKELLKLHLEVGLLRGFGFLNWVEMLCWILKPWGRGPSHFILLSEQHFGSDIPNLVALPGTAGDCSTKSVF